MQDIAYKQKYLKYKAKYLELKKGGGKKITFKSLNEQFLALKSKPEELYWKIYKNRTQEQIRTHQPQTILYKKIIKIEEGKDKKELYLTYEDENAMFKTNNEIIHSMAILPTIISAPTFGLNIVKRKSDSNEDISVLERCNEDTCVNI